MMECHEVRDRLVAWQDGELSPGETVQLEEHLDGCSDCRRHERRLADATPRPELLRPRMDQRVPAHILAALADRVDADSILAAARRPEPAPPPHASRVASWLRAEARVPRGWMLVYAAVLFGAIGFGLSSLWSPTAPPPARVGSIDDIPAGQFQPASYDPTRATPDSDPTVPEGKANDLGGPARPDGGDEGRIQ
ncbi:MAG: zf-HC2 domain-containing protein [Alphaproteobacteria bacterium]|nr:zf-HC2 domain-containing protein [Alphaproteobacteria bacterium]MCB9697415.1 zf-HC2 domain-containing protein [Alphaproteobacteria bacterium]